MATENMLLAGLPAEERDRLRSYLQYMTLGLGDVLIREEEQIDYVWFPNDCVTSTLQLLSNGDGIEAGLMGLEGFVGLQLWLHARTTVSRTLVQVPGSAFRMRSEDFVKQVMNRPESPLNLLLAKYVHGFLVLTSQTAACNRVHSLDERLCRWLRMVYNRVPDRHQMPLRQEFLAQMLGAARPTVSTAAGILQKAGYIEYSRGRLTILNPDGLAQGACECYELMESQFDRIFDVPWRPEEKRPVGTDDT